MAWKMKGFAKTQPATRTLAEKIQKMDPAIEDRPLREIR
jgi:hypothetical protein